MARQPSDPWEIAFAALAIAAAVPVWIAPQLPVQDLPQHLAAIRVLHDYGSAELGFSQFFELHLGRTQYLTYYLLTHFLSYAVGLATANKLVFTAAIVGLPFSGAALLKSLGRDERLALFLLPFAWNAHLLHGFVNFAAALPLMLWGTALAVELRLAWSTARAALLSAVALFCFYTHVVPFGVLAIAVGLMAFERDLGPTLRRLAPLVPSVAATGAWLFTSPAASAVLGREAGAKAEFRPLATNFKELGHWLFDVLEGGLDGKLLLVWAALISLAFLLADPAAEAAPASSRQALRRSLSRRLSLLVPVSLLAYLLAPAAYGWVWPINARFPIIGAVYLVTTLPNPRPAWRPRLLVLASALGLIFFLLVGRAIDGFYSVEAKGLDAAIRSIPPGQKVVGLIFDRSSQFFEHAPFLHSVALYQAERGGAVMYSFALLPSSPIAFKPGHAPPPVPPRWEWTPEMVNPKTDLGWYDYVLTRADPGVMPHNVGLFERVFEGNRWAVWKRRTVVAP